MKLLKKRKGNIQQQKLKKEEMSLVYGGDGSDFIPEVIVGR